MTETIQSLLQRRSSDTAVAVKYGDLQQSWTQYLAQSAACAAALLKAADPSRPMHIGSLLGNTPDMLTQMAAAGLSNREAADRLHLSVSTIERHLATIYRNLGLRGRVPPRRRTR